MRQTLNCWLVWIGVVSAALVAVRLCPADDWSPGGLGTQPMAPAAPPLSGYRERPVLPRPPVQPVEASRRETWPGSQPDATPWPPADPRAAANSLPPSNEPQVPAEAKLCDGMQAIARVGLVAILESEVAGGVNEILEKNKDRIPPGQLEAQRKLLIQQRLRNRIETMLIYQDARKAIPPEGWTHIEKQLTKQFEEVELEKMMQRADAKTRHELDQKLRELGTSLEREKRGFMERTLAQQWVRQQVKKDDEITYDQMLIYYRDHQADFTKPARARWEELMVRFATYPDKAAAYEALARMGNQVLGGAPLADVAKAGSDGATAADGGQWKWTTKGSLVCEELDKALFGLPIGQLSPIIEGPTGLHIIRVTEREEASVAPFLSAQVDIRQKIVQQRSEKQLKEYLARLEAKTPIWTIFDSDAANPQLSRRPESLRR